LLLLLLLNALVAKSPNYKLQQRALSWAVVGALTNRRAVSPSFLNPPGFEKYKGAVYRFIA
jgi:hypothetical protein